MPLTLTLNGRQAQLLASLLNEELYRIDSEINALQDEVQKKKTERDGISELIRTLSTVEVEEDAPEKPKFESKVDPISDLPKYSLEQDERGRNSF